MERRSFNKTLVSSIAGISISQNIFSHSKIRKKLGVIKNSPKIVKFKEGYQILI